MLTALLGGLLIGASVSLAWSGAGQIAGISGIVGRFLREPAAGGFRAWFLAGLLLTSVLLGLWGGVWGASSVAQRPLAWLLASGLLVGLGTQLGRGCTSGHGVCGISRLSPRGLVATLTFMTVAGVVVFLTRHVFAVGSH